MPGGVRGKMDFAKARKSIFGKGDSRKGRAMTGFRKGDDSSTQAPLDITSVEVDVVDVDASAMSLKEKGEIRSLVTSTAGSAPDKACTDSGAGESEGGAVAASGAPGASAPAPAPAPAPATTAVDTAAAAAAAAADDDDDDNNDEKEDGEVAQGGATKKYTAVAVACTLQALPGTAREAEGELASLCAALRVQRVELKERVLTNYAMTADVAELDTKIRLLVQKRATISEVMSAHGARHLLNSGGAASGAMDAAGNGAVALTQSTKALYGAFFYYLQTRSAYLARLLPQLTENGDIELFTRVVVYNLFGDHFETAEERRLLAIVYGALRHEFKTAVHIGSFMRANSSVTQALLAYARRPAAMAPLEDLLAPLFREVLAPDASPLELRPHSVYVELRNAHEMATGDASPLPPPGAQTDEELAAHPAVAEVLACRVPLLLAACERLLTQLEASVDAFPFGIRYIASVMQKMARDTFADVTVAQVNSIVGGFIFLRYINPAIVTPDGLNLIQTRLKPAQRRSLVLVAKVVQNLSNGLLFGEKEAFMKPCNAFLEASHARMGAWFGRLTDVDDDIARDGSVEADLFLEHVHQREHTLTLSLSEVLSMHKLVVKHQEAVLGNTATVGTASSSAAAAEAAAKRTSTVGMRAHISMPRMPSVDGYGDECPLKLVLDELGAPPESVPKSRSAADVPCMLTLEGWQAPKLATIGSVGAGDVGEDNGTDAAGVDVHVRHARSVSVWDRLEQQQADQSPAEALPVAVSAAHAAGRYSLNSFSSDDADRALKESLADVLRNVPLEAALAKIGTATPSAKGVPQKVGDGEETVTLMQLLAASHRVYEEAGDAKAIKAIDAAVKRMEQAREREGTTAGVGEARLAVLAEDAEEEHTEEQKVVAAAGLRRKLARGGSDRFMFVEAPALHPRLLNELGSSLVAMAQAQVTLSARLEKLRRAAADVDRHHTFLREKYEVFEQYLDAVRAKTQLQSSRRARIKHGLFTRKKTSTLRRTHKQLCSSGIITRSDVGANYHKLLVYKFTQPAPGMFEISAGLPGLSTFSKVFLLEELLEQQQRNNTVLSVVEVRHRQR